MRDDDVCCLCNRLGMEPITRREVGYTTDRFRKFCACAVDGIISGLGRNVRAWRLGGDEERSVHDQSERRERW